MNRVIHFEIHAKDSAKLAAFYRDVFGWQIKKWVNPHYDYWIIMTAQEGSKEPGINGGIVGRRGKLPQGNEPVTSFVSTIHVPDIDKFIKKIEEKGGQNVVPKMAITGLAWIAYCKDIEGNIFGIYQDDKKAK